ncbi:putative Protein serine/threonine phosphatase [Candidatus Zixiibacteriota bacterium]|nr:putative Protein serine/threonine phosphatase [candidate division Zixibacteria bacterium]
MALRISYSGRSDIGLVRSGNEDSFRVDPDSNLFLVCDGMGGHQAGEVASRDACEIISYCFTELASDISKNPSLHLEAPLSERGALLVKAIRLANRSIYLRSRSRSDLAGMGTTVVALAVDERIVNIAHVGDSRAYRLLPTGLVPLTTDHSWVAELKQSGQFSESEAEKIIGKNVITRALGVNERVEIDYRADLLAAGETYILCTDGLCGYAGDDEIFAAVKDCRDEIDSIVNNLIQLANDRGGQDNVSVVAVRIDEISEGAPGEKMGPVTVAVESDETLLKENQILEALSAMAERSEERDSGEAKKKSSHLALIFLIFILVAVVIIYLMTSK